MNKLFLLMGLFVFSSVLSLAQSSDYNKNEYYVGYSNQQVDNGNWETFNGFEGSYVRNFHRYVGAKADFSGAYRRHTTTSGNVTSEERRDVYNFLGGVQFKDNASEARLKPFGHVLAGVGYTRNRLICPSCIIPDFKQNDTGFAAAVGGGLDIKLSEKINLRAVQVDYNPVRAFGDTNNNIRLGIGISFK
jgi:opacity protein-like surface antigen